MKTPLIKSKRLTLRFFTLEDAPFVQKLAGEKEIAYNTLNIPYPYPDGAAEEWIATHHQFFKDRKQVNFAIERSDTKELIGVISIMDIHPTFRHAEMGYWIGKPYWNNGYCTEAGHAVLTYAFAVLKLNRIYSNHFSRNPASGRVMLKLGMKHEGCLRQHVWKWDKYENLECYGILKSEYKRDSNSVTIIEMETE